MIGGHNLRVCAVFIRFTICSIDLYYSQGVHEPMKFFGRMRRRPVSGRAVSGCISK